jgi:hypothetical protein
VLNRFLIRKERWHGHEQKKPVEDNRKEISYIWAGGIGERRNRYLQDLLWGIWCSLNARTGNKMNYRAVSFGEGNMGTFAKTIPVCAWDRPSQLPSSKGKLFSKPVIKKKLKKTSGPTPIKKLGKSTLAKTKPRKKSTSTPPASA